MAAPFRVIASDEQGKMWDLRGWTPAVRSGVEYRPGQESDWIPAPEGTRLQFLQGRCPLGWPKGSRFPEPATRMDGGLAVAAQLPSGYTRTLLPAYERTGGVPYLPFFGYTAVAYRDGQPWVAALQSDSNPHWLPRHYSPADLEARIAAHQERFPGNRVLDQLKICSLEYGCYNAQNIFLGRWEGAVPVSPACNAECVGCISQQPEGKPASPQQRFVFVPSQQEIVELGLAHLKDDDSIYSFGQGCEGEPLLQARLIAGAVKSLRQQTSRGTIHLNTNASKPDGFKLVVEAGLDSVRVSLNSVLDQPYTAYYQPRGYTFADLRRSIEVARANGVLVSLNYLHMPGWNDRQQEVEELVRFINQLDVHMIQMRTLNIDPDMYVQAVPMPAGPALGMPELVARLRKDCPRLVIGNHTLPKSRYGKQACKGEA
ncbi:MAG: radical SAM protein [Vulcanimicrobiota bacterium]